MGEGRGTEPPGGLPPEIELPDREVGEQRLGGVEERLQTLALHAFDATAALKPGSYSDDATNNGEDADTTFGGVGPFGEGVWTFSPPFQYEVHLGGVPHITVDLDFPGSALVPGCDYLH